MKKISTKTFLTKRNFTIILMVLLFAWYQPYRILQVQGHSMEPTLLNNDLVVIKPFNGVIHRGDIIVTKDPSPDLDTNGNLIVVNNIIKRIKFLPDDVFYMSQINGVMNTSYSYDELKQKLSKSDLILIDGHYVGKIYKTRVDHNKCFLQGDNTNDSIDSRDFGPIDIKNILYVVALKL